MPTNYPAVTRAEVDGFLKVYNRGGLHLLFDDQSRQAMVDFTNVALKSYVDHLVEQGNKLKAAKIAATQVVATQTAVPPSAPQKSLITLTD